MKANHILRFRNREKPRKMREMFPGMYSYHKGVEDVGMVHSLSSGCLIEFNKYQQHDEEGVVVVDYNRVDGFKTTIIEVKR